MRSFATVFALLCLCTSAFASEFTVISENTINQVVNGKAREVHTATVQCSQAGIFRYDVTDAAGGGTVPIEVDCEPPEWTYTRQLVGYISRHTELNRETVCLFGHSVNESEIASSMYESISVPTNLQTIQTPSRRRLLWIDDSTSYDDDAPAFPPNRRRLLSFEAIAQPVAVGVGVLGGSAAFGRALRGKFKRSAVQSAERVPCRWPRECDESGNYVNAAEEAEENAGAEAAEEGAVSIGSKDLAFAGGIDMIATGAGVFAGMALANHFFPPKGLNQDIIDGLTKQVTNLLDWQTEQKAQDTTFQTEIGTDRDLANAASLQSRINADDITYVNASVHALATAYETFSQEATASFRALQSELVSETNATSDLALFIQRLHSEVEQHFQHQSVVDQTLGQEATDLLVMIEQLYYDLYLGRAVTKAFFEHVHNSTHAFNGKMRPFVPATHSSVLEADLSNWVGNGRRPMSQADRDAKHTFSEAVTVAEAYLQWNDGTHAYQETYSFKCDPTFLLNYTVSGVKFNTLMYMLGPDHHNGSSCYHNSESGIWHCRCVIAHYRTTCEMDAGVDWPWVHGETYATLQQANTGASVCDSGVGNDPADLETLVSVITNIADWRTQYASSCSYAKGTSPVDHVEASLGTYDARITSVYSDRMTAVDIKTALFEQCDATQDIYTTSNNTAHSLLHNIHNFWRINYDILATSRMAELELEWFGRMPTDLKTVEYPFARDVGAEDAKKCVDVFYSQLYKDGASPVSADKVPVYIYSPSGVDQQASVRVGGTGTYTTTTDNGLKLKLPNSLLNSTVQSNIRVSTEYSNLLPGTFYSVGEWDNDPKFGDSKIIDAPFKMLNPQGSVTARCGSLMYGYQDALWNSVTSSSQITIEQWKYMNQLPWNPECANESPYHYLRGMDATTRQCEDEWFTGMDPSGGALNASVGADNELCTLFRQWKYAIVDGGTKLTLTPRSYDLVWSFETPGTHFTEYIVSACPSGYRVVYADNIATMYVQTNSEENVEIEYRVTHETDAVACSGADGVVRPFTMTGGGAESALPAFGSCDKDYYVNVRPVSSTAWCWLNPGVNLKVGTHGVATQTIPPQVNHVIASYQSAVGSRVVRDMAAVVDAMIGLMLVQYTETSQDGVASGVQTIINKLRNVTAESSAEMKNHGVDMQRAYEHLAAILAESDAAMTANKKKEEEIAKREANDNSLMNTLAEQYGNTSEEMTKSFALEEEGAKQLLRGLHEAEDASSDDCECGGINPLKWIKCMFCKIRKFFNDIVKGIMLIVGIIVLIVLIIYCGPEILGCCSSAIHSLREERVARKQQEALEKTNARVTKQKRQRAIELRAQQMHGDELASDERANLLKPKQQPSRVTLHSGSNS